MNITKKVLIFIVTGMPLWALAVPTSKLITNVESNVTQNTIGSVVAKSNSTNSIYTIDRIVAFVNKGVITSNQLDEQINLMKDTYSGKGIQIPNTLEFKNGVLNQMITLQVELDLAKKLGIETSDIEVLNAISNIAKSQGLTLEQFKAKLQKEGVSFNDFKQQAYNQIVAEKLKQREVDARIVVTDDEINRVLDSQVFKNRIDYDLSYIMVSVPEQSTLKQMDARKKLAETAYNALKNGQPFNTVSIKYSNAPNALEGGNLGWKSNIVLPIVITNELAKLKKSEFTPVLQLPMGFLIFKINDMRTITTKQEVKQYGVRHILIKVGENNSDEEAHRKIIMIEDMLNKYKNTPQLESEFTKLAKEYSEDSSSINGGSLGWVSRGDTVPAFEEVMLKTSVGSMSEPFRTPFGWHILEVEGIRSKDKTSEVLKASIRQEIINVKATLLYAQWLRNIRDSAYVKINE